MPQPGHRAGALCRPSPLPGGAVEGRVGGHEGRAGPRVVPRRGGDGGFALGPQTEVAGHRHWGPKRRLEVLGG